VDDSFYLLLWTWVRFPPPPPFHLYLGEIMKILSSKNFSLACALTNGAFAIHSFITGSLMFGLLCLAFCGYCTNNYLKAE
tara:strand:- start:99 stop:338 length:240 start_codon:yes stop_codon:yes gene_type:complete